MLWAAVAVLSCTIYCLVPPPFRLGEVSPTSLNRTYFTLAANRELLVFFPFTAQERKASALRLRDLLSIAKFGQEYRRAANATLDPIPRMDALVQSAGDMTDAEFNYALFDIFLPLRDLHTMYHAYGPHACYFFAQPLSFRMAAVSPAWLRSLQDVPAWRTYITDRRYGREDQFAVVSAFSKRSQVNDLARPALNQVEIGDVVLLYNGLTLSQFVESVKWMSGGNTDA
ncbi:hypothetical protein HDU91_001466, partial [Kappamyces sp. JEL0680]